MKKQNKALVIMVYLLMAALLAAGCSSPQPANGGSEEPAPAATGAYPEREIQTYIAWGAGGATDNVVRALAPHVNQNLPKTLVLHNLTGATGSVATQFVLSAPRDGYTMLVHAENPQLYQVLELADFSFDDFYPISIFGRGVSLVFVPADSPFDTFEELVEYARANPGALDLGHTGPGGMPFVVSAMMKEALGLEFNPVIFDGDGPAMTAMIGGHVDLSFNSLIAGGELLRAGRVKALAVLDTEPIKGIEHVAGVPPITSSYPEFAQYLPWGAFYGAYVPNDTPQEIIDVLVEAFEKGADAQEYKDFLTDFGALPMSLHGDEAQEFLNHWRSVTTWILYDSGAASRSPEEFGIPRP